MSNRYNTKQSQMVKYPLDKMSAAVWLFGTLLGKTWRYRFTGCEASNPFLPQNQTRGLIFCFWHAHLLAIAYASRKCGVKAVISKSTDGQRIAAVAYKWGHGVIAGSSSRHGVSALRECVRELSNHGNIAITPDGPRGPKEIVKPGVAQIALVAKSPIIPMSIKCNSMFCVNSWDRFCIPKPFARLDIVVYPEIDPRDFSDQKNPVDALTQSIQQVLCQ